MFTLFVPFGFKTHNLSVLVSRFKGFTILCFHDTVCTDEDETLLCLVHVSYYIRRKQLFRPAGDTSVKKEASKNTTANSMRLLSRPSGLQQIQTVWLLVTSYTVFCYLYF